MRVGLLVTCLVDLMRPGIGFAAIKLLESAGCTVVVPAAQTCCGQPGWNSGDRRSARALAEKLMDEFEGCPCVVAPSGSCAGMLRVHYPELFADEPRLPDLLRTLREKQVERRLRPWHERVGLRLWSWLAQRPGLYALVSRMGVRVLRRMAGREGMIAWLPFGAGWMKAKNGGRFMPAPGGRTFRDLQAERVRAGKTT